MRVHHRRVVLEQFVTGNTPWVHIDTYAWNQTSRLGRPEGGEALDCRRVSLYPIPPAAQENETAGSCMVRGEQHDVGDADQENFASVIHPWRYTVFGRSAGS
jgi:hypothetical protein